MINDELVLAVPADAVNQYRSFWEHTKFFRDPKGLMGSNILATYGHRWIPRAEADHMPEFKQIIPYCVVHFRDMIYTYRRGSTGGEDRLHGLRSLGFGGHINPDESDYDMGTFSSLAMYRNIWREMREELLFKEEVQLRQYPLFVTRTWIRLRGIINDNSNDVGKVHVGFVFDIDLCHPEVYPREECIAHSQFEPYDRLEDTKQHYETWSQACIDNLRDIIHLP